VIVPSLPILTHFADTITVRITKFFIHRAVWTKMFKSARVDSDVLSKFDFISDSHLVKL